MNDVMIAWMVGAIMGTIACLVGFWAARRR